VAIDPFVVADGIDQSAFEGLDLVVGCLQDFIAARQCAGFDVAHVQGEGRLHRVDRSDQPVELGGVVRQIVGHVAERHERERVVAADALSRRCGHR
jgi:hypothetical protein